MTLAISILARIGEGLLAAWCIAGVGWFLWRRLHNSQDPAVLVVRWVLTVVILCWLGYEGREAHKAMLANSPAAVGAVIAGLLGGMVLAIIWVPVLADAVSNAFGGLYTGGNEQVDPKPFYSICRALRLKGKYLEALAEVRRQLEKFPDDFEGHMLMAELQAENLNDLPGAELTIQRCCDLPGQQPGNISFALNKLADWHLGITRDREAAQRCLEKIVGQFPGSEAALRASQRIGHLADTDMLLSTHDRERFEVKKGVRDLGLVKGDDGRLRLPQQEDFERQAAEYVAHLEQHPHDAHAREKLAEIYAKHYHRLDLAVEELEQLVTQPNRPARQVAHWLNLMADLQVFEGADYQTVSATLQRIIDLFPETASALKAQRRIDTVNLELRGRDKTRSVQLGEYEKDIGLKGRKIGGN